MSIIMRRAVTVIIDERMKETALSPSFLAHNKIRKAMIPAKKTECEKKAVMECIL